ncbi:MAG: hypothetical protein R6V54_12885 [Desulfobacteraceae bacterium]
MESIYSPSFKPNKLRKMIKEDRTAEEITREFGISLFTLKEHVQVLNRRDKTRYQVRGIKEQEEKAKRIVRRRKGYVCAFDSDCLPDFRFTDAFEIEETDEKVVLKKNR